MAKLNMANMNIAFWNIRNMTKVNTLVRKGYLLAGVVIAANMFVVNYVRASINENNKIEMNINKEPIDEFFTGPYKYIGFLLQWENTINLIGGALFSFANGLYNFYKNKPSFYFDYWFVGWNSKPFAKGYLQFCPNINLGRTSFWSIISKAQIFLIDYCKTNATKKLFEKLSTNNIYQENKSFKESIDTFLDIYFFQFGEYTPTIMSCFLCVLLKTKELFCCFHIFTSLLQRFVSLPLIINFTSRVSISIALDSIIWMMACYFIDGGRTQKGIQKNLNDIEKAWSAAPAQK